MRLGYNTNGFAHHRLEDAVEILAELGYGAVALTPDVHHLPPFQAQAAGIDRLRTHLDELNLACVVETGARFVLDPRRKHRPNLLESDAAGRAVRMRHLQRCVEIAAELRAGVVSIWSGRLPAETDPADAWQLLAEGVSALCRRAEELDVLVAFEPEPGMFVETLAGWERLRDTVGSPRLGLTLDVGHVPCTETISAPDAIRRYSADLLNVHLDDTRDGVHEHLQIGEGDLDWNEIAAALREARFSRIAAVELSRHSHAAPLAAGTAIERLTAFRDG